MILISLESHQLQHKLSETTFFISSGFDLVTVDS